MTPYSVYDYLASILPGATILAAAIYAWLGLPRTEPGGSVVIGVLAASFVVGQLNSAIGAFLFPLLLRQWPWERPNSVYGLSSEFKQPIYDSMLKSIGKRLGLAEAGATVVFSAAYSELLTTPLKDMLMTLNRQIAFHRNMMAACLVSMVVSVAAFHSGRHYMNEGLWIPVLIMSTALFGVRARRFWIDFGSHVWRGAFNVAKSASGSGQPQPSSDATLGGGPR